MACRRSLDPFTVSSYTPPLLIKFLVSTDSGCVTIRVPVIHPESSEFAGLEEFYGSAFLKHLLPDYFGFKSNVIKLREFVEVRHVNFTGMHEFDSQSVRLILTKWQDSSAALKLAKYNDPQEAFRRTAAFKRLCELFSIAGFEKPISTALSRLRRRNSVLILIEPGGVILHRRPETVDTMKPLATIHGKHYYKRRGTKGFLRHLREEARCQVAFYSSYEASKLTTLFQHTKPSLARLTADIPCFGRRHCNKALANGKPRKDLSRIWQNNWSHRQRFESHNTILIDWNCEATRDFAANTLLVNKFDEHALVKCPSPRGLDHLWQYLRSLLANYEYDVRLFLTKSPFVPYS